MTAQMESPKSQKKTFPDTEEIWSAVPRVKSICKRQRPKSQKAHKLQDFRSQTCTVEVCIYGKTEKAKTDESCSILYLPMDSPVSPSRLPV